MFLWWVGPCLGREEDCLDTVQIPHLLDLFCVDVEPLAHAVPVHQTLPALFALVCAVVAVSHVHADDRMLEADGSKCRLHLKHAQMSF